jgi:NADH-quinone oxidoreductase subunit H
MFISSAVMVTLFFGGYNIPYIEKLGLAHNLETILGVLFFFAKTGLFILFFMWVRWTIPRFRFDQLMNLGWKYMIPLALVNILVTGALILIFDYFK